MEESILTSVKQALGLAADYTPFDPELIMHINSVFPKLNDFGIGPSTGFMIEDASAEWSEFLDDDPNYNDVKTYIFQSVRLVFDPPTTQALLDAYASQIKEAEWRMTARKEAELWVPPIPSTLS